MKPLQEITHSRVTISRIEETIYKDEALYDVLLKQNPQLSQELTGWARSFYTKAGHLDAILAYGNPDVPFPRDAAQRIVDEHLEMMFNGFPKVESLSFETQIKEVHFEPSSAAGYGYQGRKGDPENHKRAIRTANATVRHMSEQLAYENRDLRVIDWLMNTTPDIAFTRTQLTYLPDKLKIRNVWGEPFHLILIEGLSASPLMQFFASNHTFFIVGEDPKIKVPQLISDLLRSDKTGYCLDWSNFDASVSAEEADYAFGLIKRMMQFYSPWDELCFEISRLNFIHRKLIGPDGRHWMKHKGVPSGSYYTMLIDTIVNYRRICYIFMNLTGELPEVYCQGDDSLTGIRSRFHVDRGHIAGLCEQIGWIINPAKIRISREPVELEFLGRSSSGDYSYRERLKVIRLAVYTEYPVPTPQISTARAHALCEDSSWRLSELARCWKTLRTLYGEEENLPRQFRPFNPTQFLRA